MKVGPPLTSHLVSNMPEITQIPRILNVQTHSKKSSEFSYIKQPSKHPVCRYVWEPKEKYAIQHEKFCSSQLVETATIYVT